MKKLVLVCFLALGIISGCNNAAAPAPLAVTMPSASSLASDAGSSGFSAQLQASGGAPPFTWSLVTGSASARLSINARAGQVSGAPDPAGLPPGLTLSSTGLISGTVSSGAAPGTYSFTVKVTDSSTPPQSAQLALSITINLPPSISTATLPAGTVGTAYSATLQPSGGTSPFTWSIVAGSGTLPAGLSLNASTGVISGTPTTATTSPTPNFTVKVVDSPNGQQQSAQKLLSIKINPVQLTITTTSPLPPGTVNSAYSQTLQSSGGTSPVAWSITTGTLPQGLTLNGTSGVISGTPTAAGDFTFTARAADSSTPQQTATKPLMVTIRPALSITTASLPDGSVMTAYSAPLQSSGGTPPVTWSVNTGTLPAGLILSATGQITGTPTTAGTSMFSVLAMDSSAPRQMVTKELSIKINPAPLTITTTSLPNGTVGTAYSQTLLSSGGTPPVAWSITMGTLPNGLSLNGSTGVISGTPMTAGTSTFTVQAADSGSPQPQTATRQLSITINTSSSSKLNGNYAFLFNGFDAGGAVAIAGSFTADGNGNLTSGIEDISRVSSVTTSVAFTGTYNVGSDNRGSFTLIPSGPPGISSIFKFALGSFTAGVAGRGRFVEADSTGTRGSGVLAKQDPAAFFAAQITGGYAFGLAGIISNPPTVTSARLVADGRFSADGFGNITAGQIDLNAAVAGLPPVSKVPWAGTYSAVSTTNGRGTFTLVIPGATANFSFYVVSAAELLVMEVDPRSPALQCLLSGPALRQSGGPFAAGSLNGPGIFNLAGFKAGANPGTHATEGVATFDGVSSLNGTIDENNAGAVGSMPFTGTYTVDPDGLGHGTITIMGVSQPSSFYLVSPGKGFIISGGGSAQGGSFEPQTGGPFSKASVSGNYVLGTLPPVSSGAAGILSGVFTANGLAGTLSGTFDDTNGNAITFTGTYNVAANGRATLTITPATGTPTNLVFYLISPSKAVAITVNMGAANTAVNSVEQ